MNETETRYIPAAELTRIGTGILAANGCSRDEAGQIAERLVEANLMGHDSHGIGLIPLYVERLRSGMIKPGQHATLVSQNGGISIVDGNRGFGQIVGREAVEIGIAQALEAGVAIVALRHVHHLGRMGAWAELCAQAGLASVFFVNVTGARLVAPYNGVERRFGTNPFTCGVPGPDGVPIVMDMATSEIAAGKVSVARMRGKPVPSGSLIGADGQETTDPERLYEPPLAALRTFGGHKGFAIAFFCELFAGALTGGGGNHPDNGLNGNIYNNMLSIILNPKFISGDDGFLLEIENITNWIKSSRPQPGKNVSIPGDPEKEIYRSRNSEGIPLDRNTIKLIDDIAISHGLKSIKL